MVVKVDGPVRSVSLNSDSGHYMQPNPILSAEEPAWLAAMSEALLATGNAPKKLSPLAGLIRD